MAILGNTTAASLELYNALLISSGGTGGKTAAEARKNLGITDANNKDIYVKRAGDTMSGCLVMDGITSGNWNEGIRLNVATNGWATLTLGGAAGSTSGTGKKVWSFSRNTAGDFILAHNGSTIASYGMEFTTAGALTFNTTDVQIGSGATFAGKVFSTSTEAYGATETTRLTTKAYVDGKILDTVTSQMRYRGTAYKYAQLTDPQNGDMWLVIALPSGESRGSGWPTGADTGDTIIYYKPGNNDTARWDVVDAKDNTDQNVKQNGGSGAGYTNWRPLLIGASNSDTEGFEPSTTTGEVYGFTTISACPKDGIIRATLFKGKADTAGTADIAKWLNHNSTYARGNNGFLYFNARNINSTGDSDVTAPDDDWWHIMRMNHGNTSGYFAEIGIPLNSKKGVHWRNFSNGKVINPWRKLLDEGDVNDSLTSESTDRPLSANQGKVLNDKKLEDKVVDDYHGMALPDGTDLKWLRTTSPGFIPYTSGGPNAGHSALGTASWYFSKAYIQDVYNTLNHIGSCTLVYDSTNKCLNFNFV